MDDRLDNMSVIMKKAIEDANYGIDNSDLVTKSLKLFCPNNSGQSLMKNHLRLALNDLNSCTKVKKLEERQRFEEHYKTLEKDDNDNEDATDIVYLSVIFITNIFNMFETKRALQLYLCAFVKYLYSNTFFL